MSIVMFFFAYIEDQRVRLSGKAMSIFMFMFFFLWSVAIAFAHFELKV